MRCGCTRTMQPDTYAGPGRYRCSCGQRIAITGLPRYDARHCPMPRGNRRCNGPKDPDDWLCEPCTMMITRTALRNPEITEQLAEDNASIDYNAKYNFQFSLFRERHEEQRKASDRKADARKVCVVYYALLRPGIVKIGTSTQLPVRMESFRVPAQNVLAAEPGYFKLENARHRQFADVRIDRNREDFELDDRLQAHIDKVRSIHGDPYELVARILAKQLELAEDPNSELPFLKVE